MADDLITVTFPKEKFFITTDNHGGYLEGYCFICEKYGWEEKIEHTLDCPLFTSTGEHR